ncbi:MAG: RNA-binding transcriptional accessory protein [Okeania sp. SIO2G4]|uniref:Tex family protein n=1 Tax=unclassified Okeania TaxID=2634635 RepID=UPI0013BE83BE|nr:MULTISPECIES: Tex family protein [unclassified Okeania]NEP75013.1 RNA-binding transcriptional accessory protein [Okeania sp. SIO2G5]NEP96065.1 RNA-binding transcriptional accessory protein [Okeania sp. SIO2F5]NEQ93877.1 RNA-binding transcriptional accessory protein [Okeania sp. SIO2G4]
MLDINKTLAQELNINSKSIKNALDLLNTGATIPFVARYRKEYTNSLDETQLRNIWDRFTYLQELEERKKVILKAINDAGKLTDELQEKIDLCLQKTELEDLYLPYKPKRRTRATIAKEKGLESLAEFIKSLNNPQAKSTSIEQEAVKYIAEKKGVKNIEEAIQGASDILAESVAEKAELRSYIREYFLKSGCFSSEIKDDYPEGTTKFEMYRNFRVNVKDIAPHNMLALLRGESERILNLELDFDRDFVLSYLADSEIKTRIKEVRSFYQEMLKDALNRLMKNSLINEVRGQKKAEADIESIKTFETNLKELLLSPPAGMKPTLGIDPGFRTGCKVVVLDETGKFLKYQAIFPHKSVAEKQQASTTMKQLIQKYKIELIAIGNGTAGRETDEFMTEVISTLDKKPIKVIVNESGASIYSASKVAIEEFPDLDITVRGAISIGRRLQDPLAELVKIDPKSIGVGQYQHDVDQKLLKKKLDETVESCVNYVGVDLNTASKELLIFVSGMSSTVAKNLVKYRNENGAFKNRQEILKVSKLGGKTFELCAGFLRIRSGENPLDNTAVHPESYSVVENIAQDLVVSINQINQISNRVKSLDLKKYVTDKIGEPTLKDIISELEKPGRDPRAEFKYATFREGIKEIKDLEVGMELEGIVTNVANFGAFVDVGVHQDGLVHISQLADYFVKDPKQVVKVGQVVKVRVLEINEKLKRIGLSMRK